MMRISRYIYMLVVVSLLACSAPPVDAQNIFGRLKDKLSGKSTDGDVAKKKKSGKSAAVVDPAELSLDENVMLPRVGDKQHAAVADYMGHLAKKLASRKLARIELTRGGEVIVATIGTDQLFAPNDTVLRDNAQEFLRPYADLLKQMGMYKMIVVCHTDDTGSEAYTDHLSEARASAVYDFLFKNQLENVDLLSYALGASEPSVPNDSRENRAKNRRVEIYIVPDILILEMAKSGKLQFRN